MSVALFFITHQGIGSNLLEISQSILQKPNSNISSIEVPMDAPVEDILDQIDHTLDTMDTSQGLLFITDTYGSTPGNIAQKMANKYHTDMLSGVNLPMVIRLLNYRDDPIQALLSKAEQGALQGIQHYIYHEH